MALEVLEHLAAKGDILSMERVSLYYFDKCQFSKAFLLFKALYEKMQTTEWYDWSIKQEITYKLAHLYTYGEGVEQNLDKGLNTTKSLKMATTGETEPNTSWEGWLSKGITTWRRCITIVKI